MSVNEREVSRLMAIKAAIVATTASQGWQFIKQIAKNIEEKAKEVAIDEPDPMVGEQFRLLARAKKEAFKDLFNAIEASRNIDPQADFSTGFEEIERGE